jgi:hypothetical protein
MVRCIYFNKQELTFEEIKEKPARRVTRCTSHRKIISGENGIR